MHLATISESSIEKQKFFVILTRFDNFVSKRPDRPINERTNKVKSIFLLDLLSIDFLASS